MEPACRDDREVRQLATGTRECSIEPRRRSQRPVNLYGGVRVDHEPQPRRDRDQSPTSPAAIPNEVALLGAACPGPAGEGRIRQQRDQCKQPSIRRRMFPLSSARSVSTARSRESTTDTAVCRRRFVPRVQASQQSGGAPRWRGRSRDPAKAAGHSTRDCPTARAGRLQPGTHSSCGEHDRRWPGLLKRGGTEFDRRQRRSRPTIA